MPRDPDAPLPIIEPPQDSPPLIGSDLLFTKLWWLFWRRLEKKLEGIVLNGGGVEVGQVTFGLDSDAAGQGPAADGVNAVSKYATVLVAGVPYYGSLTCVAPPGAGTPTTLDVLFSRDHGATWTSVFPAGTANKAVFNSTDLNPNLFAAAAFQAGTSFEVGDLMIIDILTTGGATGILFEMKWRVGS